MSLFHPVHKCTFIYCTANALRVLLMKFTNLQFTYRKSPDIHVRMRRSNKGNILSYLRVRRSIIIKSYKVVRNDEYRIHINI